MGNELTPDLAEDLIRRGYEAPELDFKSQFDDSTGAWMELAKDIYGMANAGGGFIVIGVKDGAFTPIGLDESFHKDTQEWIDRVSKWSDARPNLDYLEFVKKVKGKNRKFPILHVQGSLGTLITPKMDGNYTDLSGQKIAFRQGAIYTRRDTSTAIATGKEFWNLFWSLQKRTAERSASTVTPLEVISVLNKKAEPDTIQETLWFNLFPVTEIPDYIRVAETEFRDPKALYDHIDDRASEGGNPIRYVPSFMLGEKQIYSFHPFDESNPLSLCVTRRSQPIPTKAWMDDETRNQSLVMLLNFNLKDLCRKRGFFFDRRRERFFVRYFGGPVPEITWKPYKRTSTRQLVFLKVDSQGRLSYCEHFAGRLRFVVLGKGIFLVIEPIRVLTADGVLPIDQRRNTRISTQKGFFYHNNNYLYDMKFWLHILAGNRDEIHLGQGPGKITVSVLPINPKASFGIADDQYTGEDFLDSLKSEPIEYTISYEEDTAEDNPLTETPLEE